jgi:hypothetical protein
MPNTPVRRNLELATKVWLTPHANVHEVAGLEDWVAAVDVSFHRRTVGRYLRHGGKRDANR